MPDILTDDVLWDGRDWPPKPVPQVEGQVPLLEPVDDFDVPPEAFDQ